jgi:hypothetical protein
VASRTYLGQERLETLTLDLLSSAVEVPQQRKALHPRTPDLPIILIIQIPLHLVRDIGDSHDSQLRIPPHHPPQHLLKHALHVASDRLMARDGIKPRVVRPAPVDGALHGHREPRAQRQPAPALGPPPQLARVGDDDADPVPRVGTLDGLHDGQDGALGQPARTADDAVRDDAQVLRRLAEEDDDAGRFVDVAADEDGDVGGVGGRVGRQDGFLQA